MSTELAATAAEAEYIVEETESVDFSDKIPILWHSNAPFVGSGYGTQTGLFGPLLQSELGYDVGFSAFFGLKGRRLGWMAPHTQTVHQIYPGAKDNYGNDVLGSHTSHFFAGRRGLVIFLSDVWVLKPQAAAALPMLAWSPVDHDPVTPMTVDWFMKSGAIPIAMSRFGEEQLTAAGIPDVQYVPHGFNPEIFRPADRREARKALGLPEDAFIVGMVAANLGVPSRKCFGQAFQAFANLQQTYPDAKLYLHTQLEAVNGENLVDMANALNIRLLSCDQYGYTLGNPDSVVAATMNAFSVILNPAAGEGFGVPLIEAQACGTPCIVTDFSAMPEVAPVEAGNWNVGGQMHWTPFGSWQMTPSIEGLTAALIEAYEETPEQHQARRVQVWKHASAYEAKKITLEHWKPILSWAKEEIDWRRKRMRRFSS